MTSHSFRIFTSNIDKYGYLKISILSSDSRASALKYTYWVDDIAGDKLSTSSNVGPIGVSINVPLPHLVRQTRDAVLTRLHSERPKLYTILAFLSAIGLNLEYSSLGHTY